MTRYHFTTKRLIEGDIEYFENIFRSYSRGLYFIALGLSNDPETAQDAVQEAFVSLWERRAALKPEYPVYNYLYKMVKHNVLDHFRKQETHRKHEWKIMVETEENTSYQETDFDEKLIAARRLIDSLPENCRKAFVLAVIEGIGYARAASTLGVSVNTIKTQVKIAYRRVRKLMEEIGYNYLNILL